VSLFADLEGFLHHVDDFLHPLYDIIGFGRVGLRLFAGARAAFKVVEASTEAAGEVAAAIVVEVTVKTGADLHGVGEDVRHARREDNARSGRHDTQRVPDLPYLTRQLSRGETWTYPQGGYPSGCRLTNGGIGT
jgi:hypothetical protein